MPRRKLYYGYIRNAAARKLSFKKRKQHILKKVKELTILCGIDACGIVYSPDEPEPSFWPSQRQVEKMLLHYESIPDFEKSSKKINQEAYIKESVKKMEKHLKMVESTNRDLENDHFLHQIYRAGKKFEEFQQQELISLKGYVEERKRVLEKRMQLHQGFISQGNEPILPEPETGIETGIETGTEDDEPLLEQWFINMMTNETQYEVSSSSNTVIDHADMSQGNDIINPDSSMFGINLGPNGEIVASSYINTMEICNEDINNQVDVFTDDSYNAPMVEQEGINNGNLEDINNQVVEGADDNINAVAAMFPHGNNQISVGQGEIGASSYHDMEIYNGNPNEGINLIEEATNNELGEFNHGNTQGSATLYGWSPPYVGGFNVGQDDQGSFNVINQGPELTMQDINGNGGAEHEWLPHYDLTEGFHHDILDFPNNNNMFGATLLSSNTMDVDQPNYVSYTPDYDSVGYGEIP